MDIKIVDASGKEIQSEEKPQVSQNNVSSPVLPELELGAIADVLDLSRHELSRYDDQLHTLLDYAKKQTDDHSPEGLKWAVRSLELKLGTPPLAEKRIKYLARYAYLMAEESRIKKEKESFIRQ
jgi:hypothetical protein